MGKGDPSSRDRTGRALLRAIWLLLIGGIVGTSALLWLYGPRGTERAAVAASSPARPSAMPRCVPQAPCLVLVVDDIGRDNSSLRRLMRLPLALTFAVLPHARQTEGAVALLAEAGREQLLHLPLEPESHREITDEPLVITRGSRIAAVFGAMTRRVPRAVAFNNHMGSAFCRSKESVAKLVETAKGHFPFLLDSKTTKDSRLCTTARALGLACFERDVFLDDPNDVTTVDYSLQRAARRAEQRGWAIAIGHPRPATIDALTRFAQRKTVEVVTLSTLFRAKGTLTGQSAGT